MDQGFFCRIRGVDGVPQNCEVAARSPPLAAGRTDARNGPACVGFIDRSHLHRWASPRSRCVYFSRTRTHKWAGSEDRRSLPICSRNAETLGEPVLDLRWGQSASNRESPGFSRGELQFSNMLSIRENTELRKYGYAYFRILGSGRLLTYTIMCAVWPLLDLKVSEGVP
jgi:hypothetical protein